MTWDEAAWDDLVSDLYLSAIDRHAASRVPDRFAALTGGTIASLWRLRPRDGAVLGELMTNGTAEAAAAYRDHYYQHDPWGDAVHQARYNAVLRGAEIVDDDTLARSTYYNEFGIHHGMFHMIGALVPLGPNQRGPNQLGVISILRPREASAFDAPDIAALNRALPHIHAAFRLREQLDAAATALRTEALDAALAGFGLPAVILDGHAAIVRANALAEAIPCVRHAMTRRTNPHGLMRLPAGPGHERWALLIAAAASGQAGGSFRLRDGSRSYVATITPLPAPLAALAGGVPPGRVLLLLRPLTPQPCASPAATTFGLTPAEAEVAAALSDGLSPTEIATARGVKISTVRTLLQRAQDKTDTRNLRALVRLLASLT